MNLEEINSKEKALEFWNEALSNEAAQFLLSNLPEKVLGPWQKNSRLNLITGQNVSWYDLVGNSFVIKDYQFNWTTLGLTEYHTFYNSILSPEEKEEYIDKKLQELGYILL